MNERASRALPSISGLASYMRTVGWVETERSEKFEVWTPPELDADGGDRSDIRIVLPPTNALDADQQIDEAIRALSYFESRERREITDDIARGGADALSVRLTPDTPSGQAPLGQMRRTIVALHNYVLGAAASLHVDARVLPSRRPVEAEAYADEARMSTASGSMIVHLALPLSDENDIPRMADPYGRRVTQRMRNVAVSSTALAREVNQGRKPLQVFGESEESLANSMELLALATLGGVDQQATYGLRFSTTPLSRALTTGPMRLEVTPAEQAVLAEAAEMLGERRPETDVTVTGTVIRLHRERTYGAGDVTVQGHASNDAFKERNFKVNLGEEDYNAAAVAHPLGSLLRLRGDIHLSGNRRTLKNVTLFEVLPQ